MFQGVRFYSKPGTPSCYLGRPKGTTVEHGCDVVDAVQQLNQIANAGEVEDPEISTRIAAYETAFRMQSSVPELTDLSNEPRRVLDLYGTEGADGSFAANCLLARRLAERGVRFIQLYHRDWDPHPWVDQGNCPRRRDGPERRFLQGAAALIKDLEAARGCSTRTLVVWGGEFGRTPMAQGQGRDHHIKGFSMWMAGGGIKGGITHGATDEFGYSAVENVVHVHDLHATILALFGAHRPSHRLVLSLPGPRLPHSPASPARSPSRCSPDLGRLGIQND